MGTFFLLMLDPRVYETRLASDAPLKFCSKALCNTNRMSRTSLPYRRSSHTSENGSASKAWKTVPFAETVGHFKRRGPRLNSYLIVIYCSDTLLTCAGSTSSRMSLDVSKSLANQYLQKPPNLMPFARHFLGLLSDVFLCATVSDLCGAILSCSLQRWFLCGSYFLAGSPSLGDAIWPARQGNGSWANGSYRYGRGQGYNQGGYMVRAPLVSSKHSMIGWIAPKLWWKGRSKTKEAQEAPTPFL